MTMTIVRVVIAALAALLLIFGLQAMVAGTPGAWFFVVMGVVGLAGVAFERMRYRSDAHERTRRGLDLGRGADAEPPGDPFVKTAEEFIDPTTRQRTRVYVNPATGERRYHAER
jgi:hypothetical protein